MEPDEWIPQTTPLSGLLTEDLSTLSLKELKERVARLNAEIERCKVAIEAKQGARSDAEAHFRK